MLHRSPPALAGFARRRRGLLLLLPLSVLSLSVPFGRSTAQAEAVPDFRVIVHPENPATGFTRDFLTDAFLKRTTRWGDGETLRPVDQRSTSVARQKFSDAVLGRSVAAVKNYWQQRIFSGRDLPPPELDSDDAVVSYVMSHRGALGYVSGGAKLDKAKPVAVR
jgi:ABC-type phosphate transport system substrate-binding protein